MAGISQLRQRGIEQGPRHAATHDALTNLSNRLLFQDRIKQALSSAERHHNLLAVAFVDPDNFQNVNNSLGQGIGNQVLQSMAQCLARCVRESDTIARVGSDEFVVSLPGFCSSVGFYRIAKKLLNAIAAPIEMNGRELHLTASIGIRFSLDDFRTGYPSLGYLHRFPSISSKSIAP